MNDENHLLMRALRLNALFSGVSALVMLASGRWIAAQIGLSDPLLIYVTAGFLILFSLQLANIVRSRKVRSWEIAAIIGGDVAWVAASVVLVAMYFDAFTTTGLIIVDAVALVVLYFAIQQVRGLRRVSG